ERRRRGAVPRRSQQSKGPRRHRRLRLRPPPARRRCRSAAPGSIIAIYDATRPPERPSMPPLTMTEKILARHSGRDAVAPGDNVWIDVDVLMTHDVCGPGTIGVFKQHFGKDARVWDRDKVVIIPDHYIFTADRMANRNVDVLREFVREQGLPHYYDVGTDRYKGVCHIALPEEGHTRPGEVLF